MKIKNTFLICINNIKAIYGALRLAWFNWLIFRKAGWRKSFSIAIGYFKLGLAWGGFKMPTKK